MKVVVIPKRPIPGILPKNKWISEKTVLDLNKNEIKHCMQFGNVYDEKGNLIDSISIKTLSFDVKPVVEEVVEPVMATAGYSTPVVDEVEEPEVVLTTTPVEEPVVVVTEEVVEPVVEEVVTVEPVAEEPEVVDEVPYYNLNTSYTKEDDYIILEAEVNTNSKLEGSLYGLFSVVSGTKPSIEYKSGDNWIKFSNKFANFDKIENGDKFVFRFAPKNENEFTYRILIREGSTEFVRLEGKVNPAEL